MDPPSWSPDSAHVVYAARRSRDEWVIVTDTGPGPSFPDAIAKCAVAFRGDGTVAFKASDGKKWFIVIGEERQPSFDEVSAVPAGGRHARLRGL